jgi:hypothetical protein
VTANESGKDDALRTISQLALLRGSRAAFERRLRPGKDELLDLFFGKGSRIGTGAGQMLELEISPSH